MPFPSPATNGQTYTAGGFTYTYNATKRLWVKTGYASNVEIGAVVISANVSTITVGNTSITSNGIVVGNTTITSNAITVGNTSITANAVTVGNTNIKANSITTGNTTISSDRISTGNTVITSNSISTGNIEITSDRISTGNTVISTNSISTGNVTISDTGIRAGNSFIASNGTATFTSLAVANLTANISLNDLTDVVYQTSNDLQSGYATIGRVLIWDGNNWTPGEAVAQTAITATFATTAGSATSADSTPFAEVAANANAVLSLGNLSTANLVEGEINQYFTNARVAANIALLSINTLYDVDTSFSNINNSLIWNGTNWIPGVPVFASTANVANTVVSISSFTTANLVESAVNQYFTNSRVFANIAPLLTSANLSEVGTTTTGNVFFSNARGRAALTGGLNINYDPVTGVIATANNVTFNTFTATTGTIVGNLTVIGNLVTQASNSDTLTNPIIYLANNNVTDAVDIGFVGSYKPSGDVTRMTGLFRDATDTKYKLYQNGLYSVSSVVNTSDGAFQFANLQVDTLFGKLEWANIQSKPDPVITVSLVGDVTGTASATLQDLASNTITITTTAANISPTSIISVLQNVNSGVGLTTSNVAEGSNLYYTNARVASNVALLSINVLADVDITNIVTGNSLVWDGTKFIPGIGATGASGSSDVANVSNFANTSGFANAATIANTANAVLSISNFTTSNLAEGSNLYFTNARAKLAVDNQNFQNIYVANLSAGNLTYIGNLTVDNLVATNGFIRLNSGGPNTTIQAGIWNYDFRNDGNLYVPNIIVTGAIFGNITGSINVGTLTSEQVQDYAAALFTSGSHSGVTVDYDDNNNKINLTVQGGAGGASVANTANIANLVLSLANQTTSNLAEGTNLYFTNARVAANVELLSINVLADVDTTGVTVGQILKWNGTTWAAAADNVGGSSETSSFANTANIANVVLSLGNFTTSNLAEGSNLYYTNARVYANIKPLLTTANIQEVSNLWFTNARVYANISPLLTTANVAEIVNLYYTNARVLSFVSNVPVPNITVANIRMSSTATIESTGDTNTIIKANVFNYEFRDSGFATFPNLNITSNLVLNGRLVVDSNARLSGNIIPLADNTFDLGSPNNRFRSVYISGSTIDIGSALFKFEDGKFKFQTADGTPAKTELYTGNIIEAGDTTTGNVYFTNARARAALANGNGIIYDVTTGVISIGQNVGQTSSVTFNDLTTTGNITAANYFGNVKSLSGLTTNDLVEGSNLYFTNARARAAISAGDNTIIYDPETGQIRATANVTAQVYTTISGLTTSNVAEGANLYFTNARARLAISGGTGVNYDNTTGAISIGQNVATTADVSFRNLTLTGNLNVVGNVVGFGANNLVINDGLIQLGNANPSDSIDLGFIAHYFSGSQKHTGLFRDASDGGIYKFFEGYPLEPGSAVIDTSNVFFSLANVAVNNLYGNVNWSNIVSKPSPVVTLSITGDVSGTASATLQNLTSNTISISVATKGSTSNIAEGSNLYYTNARVLSVVAQSNIANLTVTSNIVAGNVIATRFVGDGSQLTGISASGITGVNTSNLSLLPTYNGNALIGNLVVSGNATAGNILLVLGNASITGNLAVGNVNATRFVGDGSQLTGISTTGVSEGANLYYTNARVASYVANVQLPNLTVSGNVSAGNVLVSNFITKSAGTGNITVLTSGNIILDTGATRTRFFDTGNVVFPGNVVAGTFFVGDGSRLTGIATSLSGMATYAGNILATNIVSNVLTVTGNITAANLVSGNSYLSFTNDSNVLIYAGNALYRFNDTGNLIIPGNLVTGNSSLAFTNDSNIVLTAGSAVYRFGDNSSANLPNIVVNGNVTASNVIATFFVGNGSLLTGVVSSQTVTTTVANSSLSNLTVTGTIVSGNVSLSGRLYGNVTGNAAIFTQNVVVGNVYIDPAASGRFYGNITANTALFTGNVFFTGNTGVLANIGTFTSNVTVGNLIVGNLISTAVGTNANLIIDPDGTGAVILPVNTSLIVQSNIRSNSNVTGAVIITGGLGVGGNIYSGANIVATGNVFGTYFVGNGALLTGITTSLSGLATYNGNALISNLVVTSNLNVLGNLTVANITANTVTVTGNLNIGVVSGTSISTTSDNNTIIRAGTTSYLFGDGGRAEFPNLLVNGNITAIGNVSGSFFFGNGSLLTGISAASVDLKTYGGNILASNIVANTITTGNLFIGNTGAALVSISNDNNTKIQSGSATYLFPDNNRAELPNLLVVGNVTVGLSNAAVYASSGDANTLIRAGDKTYSFTDRGDAIFPNLIIGSNLTIGNASVSTNSVDNNTIIKAGTSFYTFSDGNYAIMPNLLINGNITVGPTLSSGAVFTNNSLDNNTVIRSGSIVYTFGDGGAALFPNLIIGGGTNGTLKIGDGASVTQTTSRSTSVAINKPTGRITLVSAFASTTANTFQVVNNTVSSTDVIILNQQAGIDRYATFVSNVQANSFNVTFYAIAASATEQPVFNFVVIEGSAT